MLRRATFALVVFSAGPLACGGSGSNAAVAGPTASVGDAGDDAAAADAGAPIEAAPAAEASALDYGAPSSVYPAFPTGLGQIQYNAGYVMTTPVIVPITWEGDPSQARFDEFAANLGATSYFHATTSEYGVMAAVVAPPVHMPSPVPAQLSDTDLQNLVKANAGVLQPDAGDDDAGGPAWPAPTENTVYAFFLPPGTSLSLASTQGGAPGDACSQGVGGYHDQVTVGSVTTSYAVAASCDLGNGYSAYQQSTISMSHEIIESATDPHPQDKFNGWVGFDSDHFAFEWYLQFQSEIADACEFFSTSDYEDVETTPAFDFFVQRTWSNASAAAGHDPCVPPPAAGAYFNVTPLNLKYVSVTLPTQLTGSVQAEVVTTQGVRILPGSSGTIDLGFTSDGPTGGDWSLAAGGAYGTGTSSSNVTVTIDKTAGQNGEKAYATVAVASAGQLGAELVVFRSTRNGVTHAMPVVVSSE